MKRFISLMLLLCLIYFTNAQQVSSKKIRPLRVGQKIPELQLNNLLYYTKPGAKLSAFKSKLFLIDFWEIHCGACVEAIPKMQLLQKKFGKDLSFLMVSSEDKTKIKEFFDRRERVMEINNTIPCLAEDRTLRKLFPHEAFPHYVWIDRKGIVRSITSGTEINQKNIQEFIESDKVVTDQKKDIQLPFNYDQPLFVNQNGGNGQQFLYHSVLAKFIKGVTFSSEMGNTDSTGFIKIFNNDILRIYEVAYDDYANNMYGIMGIPDNRVLVETVDNSKLTGLYGEKMRYENLYCYELILPDTSSAKLKSTMREDLYHYFGLDAHMEKRKMTCLVLTTDDSTEISSKGKNVTRKSTGVTQFKYDFPNGPFWEFTRILIYQYLLKSPYPVIDDTGIKGKVNLSFEADLSDWQSVAKAIEKFKLHLTLQTRDIDMLVLRDRKVQVIKQ